MTKNTITIRIDLRTAFTQLERDALLLKMAELCEDWRDEVKQKYVTS